MILLMDAGNSRLKWRLQARGRIQSRGELPTASSGELIQAWLGIKAEAACVSSVAGDEVNRAIQRGLDQVLPEPGDRAVWLTSPTEGHGVLNLYQPAESLGSDRFAALVGAHRRRAEDWVVVNVGTAMTADMLTADGRFLGGVIVPGPELMRGALERGTSRVRTHPPAPASGPPTDTQAAVEQGIAWALWGAVEGVSRLLAQAVGRPPRVLLAGGARAVLRPLLTGDVVETDELVLEGMAWIARDLGYDA